MDFPSAYSNLILAHFKGHPDHWNGMSPNILVFILINFQLNSTEFFVGINNECVNNQVFTHDSFKMKDKQNYTIVRW